MIDLRYNFFYKSAIANLVPLLEQRKKIDEFQWIENLMENFPLKLFGTKD
jgi:hypothetical protein